MSRTRPPVGSEPALRTDQRRRLAGSLLLAVLLAAGLSVLLAVAAPAMAADGVDGLTVDPVESDAGETGSHTVELSATGVNETGAVTVAFPDAFGDDGDGSVGAVGPDDVTVDGGDLDGDPAVEDGGVTFPVDVDGESADVDVTVTVELTQPWAADTHDVTAVVESSDGTAASETAADAFETTVNPTYLVDGRPRSTVFDGQSVTVAGLEPGVDYQLRRGDEDDSAPVVTETAGPDGTFAIDTTDLAVDDDYFLDGVDDPTAGDGFELVDHELSAAFGAETVADAGDGATTSFSVDSDLRTGSYPVDVSAGGALDAAELFRIFTGGESADGVARDADPDDLDSATTTVGPSGFEVALYDPDVDDANDRIALVDGGENAGTVTFADVTRTTYDVEARALDTDATDAASVTVEEASLGGSFGQEIYTSTAGDLVTISADLGEADEGYVIVGGDRQSDPDVSSGYLDVLYVEGNPTITINTRLIGTDADTDEVYASDGTVVSYAHEYGPETHAADTETFSDLGFEDEDGNEIADDLSGFRSAAGTGRIAGPLIPLRYGLVVGNGDAIVVRDDGVVQPERRFAGSNLLLTAPEFRESIEIHDVPSGSASGEESVGDLLDGGLERTNVTEGDRIVFGLEASGIWGALAHLSDEETVYEDREANAVLLDDLLAADEGVSLSVRQTNPGRNERRTELDLASASTGDAYLRFDDPEDLSDLGDGPTMGAVYLVVDTRGDAFTDELSPGDEFEVEFALEGDEGERFRFDRSGSGPPGPFEAESVGDDRIDQQFPYWAHDEGGVNATATFRIREERLEYDRTTADGDLLVENDDGATISGNTTMLPSTELQAELISDAGPTPTVSSTDVGIDDDGHFSIDADFSAVEPGQRVIFELYDSEGLYDRRSVVVVTDPDDPFSFVIENASETVTVVEGGTLENLTASVRNEGDIRGVDRLELAVDGGSIRADERVRLRPDRSETVGFDDATVDLEPGEYPFTLGVEGDETDGTLIVEESDGGTDLADDAEPDGADGADGVDGGAADDAADAVAVDEPVADDAADGGADDTGDGDDGDDDAGDGDDGGDEDAAATLIPLGIGTREVLGGTTIVGATYVLGHWV
ncbi:BGTF surface domain-containing protein [Halorubrum sp. DTA98]|uniref:BGTF surface domain-containing protein n=1 Tax=Halorubrum sp. DTA98 TaxID=3402163 RepID=UPI003AB02A44